MAGNTHSAFGEPWADTDHNGRGTRDDILHRDLTHIVARGTLHDPYTGKTINFVRGGRHLDGGADRPRRRARRRLAHRAAAWTPARRLAYANTPLVLLAVDGQANEAKGGGDAAEWLPPRVGVRCRYLPRTTVDQDALSALGHTGRAQRDQPHPRQPLLAQIRPPAQDLAAARLASGSEVSITSSTALSQLCPMPPTLRCAAGRARIATPQTILALLARYRQVPLQQK